MHESVMSMDFSTLAEGDRVRYISGSRQHLLRDKIGIVKAVRYDSAGQAMSAGVQFDGVEEHVWASVGTWRKLPALIEQDFDVDKIFTDAAGGPLAVAKAELSRLEARVAELKAAIQVIESV